MLRRHWRVAAIAVPSLLLASACTSATALQDATDTRSVPVDPAACVVTELLVPACGAWLGASTPSADGQYDWVRGLVEYESITAHEPDILHFYQRGAEPFPTAEHEALAKRPGKQRSILYFSWKPAPDLTWRQVADGEADASISSVALGLIDHPHKFFLTIHHEPENDVIDQVDSGMTPADYVAMYRHVVARLRELGVDNVVFVMGYMGFERWAPIVDALYPGDDVIDWIAYDPYGFQTDDTFAGLLNKPNDDGWPGFYRWATEKAPGTPIMLGEWGYNVGVHPTAPGLLGGAPETLQQEFPMIKALVYWNSKSGRVDARLGQGGELADRFAEAYAELANDPFFNSTPTDLAP